MACGTGEQHGLEVELDERLVVVRGRYVDDGALLDELPGHGLSQLGVVQHSSSAGGVEGVLVPGGREAVQRVAGVAPDVLQLGRRDDEREQSLFVEDGADRVHSRPAIRTNRGQEPEPNPELVEEIAPGRREFGSLLLQMPPGRHMARWCPAEFASSRPTLRSGLDGGGAFAALADPTRQRIVEIRSVTHELPAGRVAESFPAMTRAAVSRHLRTLENAGLLEVRSSAQQRLYRLNPEPLAEFDAWLGRYRGLWTRKVSSLVKHLDES